MEYEKIVIQVINTLLKEVWPSNEPLSFSVDRPRSAEYGDLTTNVAFVVAKTKSVPLAQATSMLTQDLKNKLKEAGVPVARVEVKNGGYINMFFDQSKATNILAVILKNPNSYGRGTSWSGKKVIVEYTNQNPFKLFHIGHLMSNTIGESLVRLYEYAGADVRRVNYQGDVGMHVAKSIWGWMQLFQEEGLTLDDLRTQSLAERATYLGRAYAKGAMAFEDDEFVAAEIKRINTYVYIVAQERLVKEEGWTPQINYRELGTIDENALATVRDLYLAGREWSLAYFEEIYKRLNTKFDGYYFESKAAEYGLKIVRDNIQNGIFEASAGAVVFLGEKYGLHTRVFINGAGLPVYEAKDLALAHMKRDDYDYDKSIIVTANEIDEYFRVVLTALAQINPQLAAKTEHLSHGMLRLKSGKMSARTGNVITGEGMLAEIKDHVAKLITGSRGLDENELANVIEVVAVGAWKYSVLKQRIGRDIPFDFKESVSLDGNSGPYLQYTYARIQSVLRNDDRGLGFSEYSASEVQDKEMLVLNRLGRFPAIMADAASHNAPHLVCNYLFELAQAFNSFYHESQILVDDEQTRRFRLALTAAVGVVLKNGLNVLAMKTVERM